MRCDEIGIKQTRQAFVDFLNEVKGGQFFHIRGYVNTAGEKSDQWLRYGVNYGNLKIRDIATMRAAMDGTKPFIVKVTHGVWIRDELLTMNDMFSPNGETDVWTKASFANTIMDGHSRRAEFTGYMNLLDIVKFGNRKAAGKTQVTLSYELSSTHPLVIAAIGEADLQGTILQGLVRPRASATQYDKEAKSCYSLDQKGMPAKWYLRDVLSVSKTIRVEGHYPFKASHPINAVKKAIVSQFLLTGKYRQFVLTDGQFESVTIAGQAILVDGIEEDFYFALPSDVKDAIREEAIV